MYLVAPTVALIIVTVYRVCQTYITYDGTIALYTTGVKSIVAFWVMQITFEL